MSVSFGLVVPMCVVFFNSCLRFLSCYLVVFILVLLVSPSDWLFLSFFLSFFLIWGDTRSLRMPVLRPASQAGPMCNLREGTSVVLHDTTRLT